MLISRIVFPSGLLLFLLDLGWSSFFKNDSLHERFRSIAETHYWHGVALAHMNKWSEAETALNKALDQIDARIHTIEMMEPSEHMTHEKDDLEELMIAVVARIEDQKDMQKGTYVEEEIVSGKIPYMQAVEGALQHAKKSGAQSASTA